MKTQTKKSPVASPSLPPLPPPPSGVRKCITCGKVTTDLRQQRCRKCYAEAMASGEIQKSIPIDGSTPIMIRLSSKLLERITKDAAQIKMKKAAYIRMMLEKYYD